MRTCVPSRRLNSLLHQRIVPHQVNCSHQMFGYQRNKHYNLICIPNIPFPNTILQALDAESAAKLKIQAALEIELAEIDETNNELDQEIVKRSVQYKIFKNITYVTTLSKWRFYWRKLFTCIFNRITKGEKLLDDVRNVHESWLAETERTAQHRTRLAEMLSTKMTNMEEEERQLKMHIAEQELEGLFYLLCIRFAIILDSFFISDAQLQATIAVRSLADFMEIFSNIIIVL